MPLICDCNIMWLVLFSNINNIYQPTKCKLCANLPSKVNPNYNQIIYLLRSVKLEEWFGDSKELEEWFGDLVKQLGSFLFLVGVNVLSCLTGISQLLSQALYSIPKLMIYQLLRELSIAVPFQECTMSQKSGIVTRRPVWQLDTIFDVLID